jgi:hypothetical protein
LEASLQKRSEKMDIRLSNGMEHIGQDDLDLYENMKRSHLHDDASRFQLATWRIRDGIRLAQPIENFLDLHCSDEFMTVYGKAAIVQSVLEAEGNSKLYYDLMILLGAAAAPPSTLRSWRILGSSSSSRA